MGAMGQFYWDGFIGIRRGKEGLAFADMELGPLVTGHTALTSAAGEVLTPHGTVKVAWTADVTTGKVSVNCTVPANARANVVVPTSSSVRGGSNADERAGGDVVRMLFQSGASNGRRLDGGAEVVVWSESRGSATPLPNGVQSVQKVPNGVQLQLGSGQYSFSAYSF